VTSHNHPLAKRVSVDLKELKNEKFILTPPASGHYQDFYNACVTEGFVPNVLLKCAIVKTMLSFAREELGITVLSSKVAAAEKYPDMKIIKITPTIHRKISLAVRSTDIPPTLKVFLKFASQWFKTQDSYEDIRDTAVNSSVTSRNIKLVYSRDNMRLRPAR